MTIKANSIMEFLTSFKSLLKLGPAKNGLIICFVLVFLDQFTKQTVLTQITETDSVPILPILDFVLIWNTGISYGLFDSSGMFGRVTLSVLGLLITLFLLVQMVRSTGKLERLGYCLIIGGAIGNIIDRVIFGGVIDFISFHYENYYWYVFNLADVWISLGVITILWDSFFLSGKTPDGV